MIRMLPGKRMAAWFRRKKIVEFSASEGTRINANENECLVVQ